MKRNSVTASSYIFPTSVLLLWLVFSLACCQKNNESGLIRENLLSVVTAAEKKDMDGVLRILAEDYRDFENRDVKATTELLEFYFRHYYGIVIHLLEMETLINQDTAEVRAEVLFSSGPLETLRKNLGLVGSFFRFKFKMSKGVNGWKIKYAEWWEVEENSLLPGSKTILKKLFPDLF
ncbi:MAG: hypothetical protein H5U07_10130 [Candidatus Aminicenantes bacterium]|nr:hypothetical protein [Candidatus Aminicenantes bacterium]